MGVENVFLCYLPGADLRHLRSEQTPFLWSVFEARGRAVIRTLPSSELLSTTLTGQYPHDHGIWQARLVPAPPQGPLGRLWRRLPDFITVTAQCFVHQFTGRCDVPTLPPRRRGRLAFERVKFRYHADTADLLAALGDAPSLVSALGDDCAYHFTDRFNDRDRCLAERATGEHALEILQFHSLDQLGHWYLDTPEKFRTFYGETDAFLQRMHEKCVRNGITMVVVSDHGQEPVHTTLDLRARLRALPVGDDAYTHYVQSAMARFWFHEERARTEVTAALEDMGHGTLLGRRDLRRFGIEFEDDRYGELYFVPDPGYMFFPQDFHHFVPNLVFGLRDWQQRRRLRTPRHLSYHGYLPEHPSEEGFITVLDEGFQLTADEIKLVDVAPTLLGMLGRPAPEWMAGTCRVAG